MTTVAGTQARRAQSRGRRRLNNAVLVESSGELIGSSRGAPAPKRSTQGPVGVRDTAPVGGKTTDELRVRAGTRLEDDRIDTRGCGCRRPFRRPFASRVSITAAMSSILSATSD